MKETNIHRKHCKDCCKTWIDKSANNEIDEFHCLKCHETFVKNYYIKHCDKCCGVYNNSSHKHCKSCCTTYSLAEQCCTTCNIKDIKKNLLSKK